MSAGLSHFVDTLELPEESGPAWLRSLRESAADVVRQEGLPTRKVEAWRFTPLKGIEGEAFQAIPSPASEQLADGRPQHVEVLNGRLVSVGSLPDGVRVRNLREILDDEPNGLEGELGTLVPLRDFAALNAALFEDVVVIDVEAGVELEQPISISHRAEGEVATVAYPRLLLRVGERASCSLVERFMGEPSASWLASEVTEVRLARGSRLHHARIVSGHAQRAHLSELGVTVEADAHYESASVVLGGKLVRLSANVRLCGRGAEANLNGVYLARDRDIVDHHIRLEHEVSDCQSNQVFRGVLADRGHGVFDGIIVVHRDAQRTAAHMQNRNLLLSDTATIHTKPHLEIDADDVACSHGATIGALDDDQLFYLRSRGVPMPLARAMLTYAFIRQTLENLPNDRLLQEASDAVLDWLPDGAVLREMLA